MQHSFIFSFLIFFIIQTNIGKVCAQGLIYPQTYPHTHVYPHHLRDAYEENPPPQSVIIHIPTHEYYTKPPLVPFIHTRSIYGLPGLHTGWFYTQHSYQEALKKSKERQRRLLHDSYPSDLQQHPEGLVQPRAY